MTCAPVLPLLVVMVCWFTAGAGCSTKPPAPKPTSGEAKSQVNKPSPDAMTTAPRSAVTPAKDAVAGDPIRRVQYRRVIFSRLPDNLRLSGRVEIVHEPDERDDSYLACRAVDVSTVSREIQSAHAKSWRLFQDDGTSCVEQLKDLEACGWWLPKPGTPVAGPGRQSPSPAAKKVFTEGQKFITGTIAGDDCHLARWASPEDVRFWPTNTAPDGMRSRVIAAAHALPEYADRQQEYEKFKELVRTTSARATTSGSRPALPEAWLDLSGDTADWLVAPTVGSQLVVTYFKRRPTYDQVPASLIKASNPAGFCAGLVSISIVLENSQALAPVGLEAPVRGCEEFQVVGAVTNRAGLPMLLFERTGAAGGLRFDGSRYVIDRTLTAGPVAGENGRTP